MYGVYNMMSYQNPELFTLADHAYVYHIRSTSAWLRRRRARTIKLIILCETGSRYNSSILRRLAVESMNCTIITFTLNAQIRYETSKLIEIMNRGTHSISLIPRLESLGTRLLEVLSEKRKTTVASWQGKTGKFQAPWPLYAFLIRFWLGPSTQFESHPPSLAPRARASRSRRAQPFSRLAGV